MFGKVLNLRFSSVSEAKIAASFCSENFGSKISEYDIIGLNINILEIFRNFLCRNSGIFVYEVGRKTS